MTKNSAGGPSHPGVKPATRFVTGGRDPSAFHGFVNPPVVHASTVLYPTVDDYEARRGRYTYGRRGTPTSEALAGALAEIEGPQCAGVALLPSGLAAASLALQSASQCRRPRAGHRQCLRADAEILRHACSAAAASRPPISIRLIGGDIATLMQPNTRAVYLESPGSLSFEVQDVPAIAAAAHARGAVVLMDNTWASPLYFRALEKGVDLAIQSGSKYIGGHSDLMLGVVAANAAMLAAAQSHGVRDGAVRRPRRHVSRHARPAHHGGSACASLPGRAEGRALVRAAAGGRARPAPCA